MTHDQLVERIKQCPNLPSLPSLAVQVLDLTQKPEADIGEIARLISRDPALSSKILRRVNSSFYGRTQHVSTISQALVILGLQAVKTLVLGFSLVMSLRTQKSRGFHHLNYWKRSIYAATAARTLAARFGVVQQEEVFLAALLQDIGMLVLDQVLGEEYGKIYESVTTHAALAAAETAALGMDHAAVGALMAAEWNLPPLLAVPVRCHNNPETVTDATLRKLTELVGLAGCCAGVFVDETPAASIAAVRQTCGERYQMSEPDCDSMLEEIGRATRETASLFEISIGNAMSFATVLDKARKALEQITLQTQQQAATLQEQNEQLREQATTDALTGLSNRRRFDGFLQEQCAIVERESAWLSLVLLDIDQFKSINDRHGHEAGDRVLRELGALLATAVRPHDLAARYGGDELVLVLPGTPRETAATIAESIRRAIAARNVPGKNRGHIKVTASIGVAAMEPQGPLKQASHLLKAADMAVYAAKHAGRNCVRVCHLPKLPARAA